MKDAEILFFAGLLVVSAVFLVFVFVIRGIPIVSQYFSVVEVAGMMILLILLVSIAMRGESSKG